MPWSHVDNRLYTKGIELQYTVSANLEPKQTQSLLRRVNTNVCQVHSSVRGHMVEGSKSK